MDEFSADKTLSVDFNPSFMPPHSEAINNLALNGIPIAYKAVDTLDIIYPYVYNCRIQDSEKPIMFSGEEYGVTFMTMPCHMERWK